MRANQSLDKINLLSYIHVIFICQINLMYLTNNLVHKLVKSNQGFDWNLILFTITIKRN